MIEKIKQYIINKPELSLPLEQGQQDITLSFGGTISTQRILYNPMYSQAAIDMDVYDELMNELNNHKGVELIYPLNHSNIRVAKVEIFYSPFYDAFQVYEDIIKTFDTTLKFIKEWNSTINFVDELYEKPRKPEHKI